MKKDDASRKSVSHLSSRKPPSTREHVSEAIKVASHPVRSEILRALREAPSSAVELEKKTGRSRYDLYHHLGVLEASGLAEHRFRDGKTKEFSLRTPSRPDHVVLLLDRTELKKNAKALRDLVRAAEALEGTKIPHKSKISGVQIIFSFPWSPEA